jgi:hypothetical protein
MVLTAAVPDETMLVRGFEHQTFRCFDCAVTEQRHTFTGGNPAAAEPRLPATTSFESQNRIEPAHRGDEVAGAWIRATERLRSHQAEIRQRGGEAKSTDWNSEFNQAWKQLAPARPASVQNGHAAFAKPKDLAAMFARSVRGRLRKTAAMSGRLPRAPTPSAEPSPEAAQEFKRFWDSLAPGSTPLQLPAEPLRASNGSAHALLPLPKSVSLVSIEAPAATSTAARAISLLRGSIAAWGGIG